MDGHEKRVVLFWVLYPEYEECGNQRCVSESAVGCEGADGEPASVFEPLNLDAESVTIALFPGEVDKVD